jgi:hypothetical protein
MTTERRERIVAEVSKTWVARDPDHRVLAERFEAVIDRNRDRGYTLESWQLVTATTANGQLVETIIAVFYRTHPNEPPPRKDA